MKVFEKPGKHNTDECVKLAYERAKELGINEVVVATNQGFTADKVIETFEGFRITVVNHHAGFREAWTVELPADKIKEYERKGVKVIIAGHALSGIERSFRSKHQGIYPMELTAEVLRTFGEGTKVCVEIALMAADAGALSGEPIMSIGGTGTGADTAIVLTPVNQRNFLEMRIHEIVCKPW